MDQFISWTTDVIRHPFFLALVTAFLVNGVTRRWQDRQKTLEIATGLVATMSEATTTALLAADRARRLLGSRGARPDDQSAFRRPPESGEERQQHISELLEAREKWERDSAVLGTKLEAYFPSRHAHRKHIPAVAQEWTTFSERVGESMSVPDNGILDEKEGRNWPAEQKRLLMTKSYLIRLVLDQQPTGSAPSLRRWAIRKRQPTVDGEDQAAGGSSVRIGTEAVPTVQAMGGATHDEPAPGSERADR